MNNLQGKCVLVTGGTMGIGLATGLAFARQGARVTLTNKWGTADEDEIRARFASENLSTPRIITADASREEDTEGLLAELRRDFDAVEVFVAIETLETNTSTALVVRSLE